MQTINAVISTPVIFACPVLGDGQVGNHITAQEMILLGNGPALLKTVVLCFESL